MTAAMKVLGAWPWVKVVIPVVGVGVSGLFGLWGSSGLVVSRSITMRRSSLMARIVGGMGWVWEVVGSSARVWRFALGGRGGIVSVFCGAGER